MTKQQFKRFLQVLIAAGAVAILVYLGPDASELFVNLTKET